MIVKPFIFFWKSSSVAEGDFFILFAESSSSGSGQKCYWIVDHLRKTSDFTMLSVNGQQFSPEKVLFLPRPTRVFWVFILCAILVGLSVISRRDLGGLSKMVIYFLLAFTPYSHPSNKNRCLFLGWIDSLLTPDWRFIDTLLTKNVILKHEQFPLYSLLVPNLFPPHSQNSWLKICFLLVNFRSWSWNPMTFRRPQNASETFWITNDKYVERFSDALRMFLRRFVCGINQMLWQWQA